MNTVLTNGARYYVDHAHPECSTPECRTTTETVLYDRAAEEIMRLSMERAKAMLGNGVKLSSTKTTVTVKAIATAATKTSWLIGRCRLAASFHKLRRTL